MIHGLMTRDDVVEYIKHRVGYPALDLELNLEEKNGFGHVHLAINDSLNWFYRHNQDEANYHDWMVIYARAGVIEYNTPAHITDVIEVAPTMGNAITPWSAMDVGPGESLMATTGWQQFDLVTYVAAQRYVSDIKKLLGVVYQVRFHPVQRKLIIYPTPKTDRMLICKVYRKAMVYEIFANQLFLDYACARLKVIWGEILTRDDNTMPDGGKVNGDRLLSDARSDIDKYEKMIFEESARPFIMTDLDL
jgi:hypothetical protein